MKLYLLKGTAPGYVTYDSAVVAAKSVKLARMIHPDGRGVWDNGYWVETPEDVTVKYLGVAGEGVEAGVILASFNAG